MWPECRAKNIIRIGFNSGDPESYALARSGDWDGYEDLAKRWSGNPKSASNQVQTFFEDTGDILWVTAAGGEVYYGLTTGGPILPDPDAKDYTVRHMDANGWQSTDAAGHILRPNELDPAASRTFLFRGTSCDFSAEGERYLRRRLAGQIADTPAASADATPTEQASRQTMFFSYRREIAPDLSGRIFDRLRGEFGDKVFRDQDNIPPGVVWEEALKDALRNCAIFLAIIGPGWLDVKDEEGARRIDQENDWVRTELETALNAEEAFKMRIVPVLLNDAAMPIPDELPESLRLLHKRHFVRVRSDPEFEVTIRSLIEKLR